MGKLFGDIYGQPTAVRLLSTQLKNNHLDHAYLFLGGEGLGKRYLAKRFAQYLLCEKGEGDQCQSCRLLNSGNHPDLITIEGDSGIKIDEVRKIIERINLSPNISKRKVVLISNAENLGIEAANALLKTLEEPPLDSIIMLTAISIKSLPETVISRVQKIKMVPIGPINTEKILANFTSDKKISKEAYKLSEESISEAKKVIEDKSYREKKEQLYRDILSLLFSKSIIEKNQILDFYDKNKELIWLFDALYYLVTKSLEKDDSDNEFIKQIKNNLTSQLRAKLSQKMLKIYDILKYNVNLRLNLEVMLMEQLTND